jgi:hypothetical protein
VTSASIFGCRRVIVSHAIRSADSVLYRLSFHLVALSGGRHTECACYGEIRISISSLVTSTASFGCRLVIVSHAIQSADSVLYRLSFHLVALSGGRHTERP